MILQVAAAVLMLVSSIQLQASQPAAGEIVYIALGDSVAAGIGSSLPRERSYAALLGEYFETHLDAQVAVRNLAEPEESAESFVTDGQLEEFRSTVEEVLASGSTLQAVTLTLGGNDVLDLRDESNAVRAAALEAFRTTFPNALQFVRDAAGPDIPVYVSTIYDPTEESPDVRFSDAWWIAQFNAVIREASAGTGVTLVDLAAVLDDEAHDLTRYPADIHPTNAGHARIATEFWRVAALDDQPPELTLLSDTSFARHTPTLRFAVDPDTDLASIVVRAGDERAAVYPPVEVAPREFAVLIDASSFAPEALDVSVTASDAAGNVSELAAQLTFSTSP